MLREISRKYYTEEFQLAPTDVDDLINEAFTTLNRSIKEFEKLFADGDDMAAIREAAHAMKGNLLNMGLDDQADMALSIERSDNTDTAQDHFSNLKKELEAF